MADERIRQPVKLVDPDTDANEAAVSATGALSVDVEEFPTAAALADGNNPTVTSIGSHLMGFDGTNWDRIYVVADGDGVDAATKGFLMFGTDGTLYQPISVNASGEVDVNLGSAIPTGSNTIGDIANITTTVTPGVASGNLGKAVDAVAGGTDTGVAVLVERVNTPSAITPADGDYTVLSVDANGRLHVTDPGAGGGQTDDDDDTITAGQTGLSLQIGLNYGFDGTQWERIRTDASGAMDVNVTVALPTGTNSIGDIANIGVSVTPGTAAGNLGKAVDSVVGGTDTGVAILAERVTTPSAITPANGDYAGLSVDDNGRLHVTDPNAGAGTPTSPIVDTPALANIASGSSSGADEFKTANLGNGGPNTRQLTGFDVSATVPFRATLIEENNDVETIKVRAIFGRAGETIQWRPPHPNYFSVTFADTGGFDGWRVAVTNLDTGQTTDFYVVFYYEG